MAKGFRRGCLLPLMIGITGSSIGGVVVAVLAGQIKIDLPPVSVPNLGSLLGHPIELPLWLGLLAGLSLICLMVLLALIGSIIILESSKATETPIGAWVRMGPVEYHVDGTLLDDDETDPYVDIEGPYCAECKATIDTRSTEILMGVCPNCRARLAPPLHNGETKKQVETMVVARWRRLRREGKEPYLDRNQSFEHEESRDDPGRLQSP